MKFLDFLRLAFDKDFWTKKKVVCFKGENYSFLFFNKLFTYLNQKNILPASYKSLIFDQLDKKSILENLTQSFLGQHSFYWLGQLHIKATDKKKLELLNFLLDFSGPNFASFYLSSFKLPSSIVSNLKKIVLIEFDEKIKILTFEAIRKFFNIELSYKKTILVKKLFKKFSAISIDQACLLLQYLELVKVDNDEKLEEYLLSVVSDVKPSLNLLSQYFFEYKPKLFFKIWSLIEKDYSEMFWIAFWSEQIYRAYFVVKFLKCNNFIKARSLSFCLPYMFLNRDWKKSSLNDLLNHYNFLYETDFSIKNGSTFCSLDLFYLNHFARREH